MKSLLAKYKWLYLVLGAVLLAVGIVTMVIAINNPGNLTRLLCIIWAVFCFIVGAFGLATELAINPKSPYFSVIIAAGLIIGFGVFLCLEEATSVLNILVLVGVPWIVVGVGSALVVKGIVLAVKKVTNYALFVSFIVGTILVTVGIISWILRDDMLTIIYIVVGSLITVAGILTVIKGVMLLTKKSGTKN